MPDQATISKLIEILREAAQPTRIVLFGSHARGEADAFSDLDVLVVEKHVPDRAAEIVRLNRALSRLRLPVELLVVSEETFNYWRETPGNVYFEAATGGKVLYEAP